MSMAPRPHTSPSTSSPPNGSRSHPLGVTGTTSVWPMRHSARRARDRSPRCGRRASGGPGVRLEAVDVEPGALEVVARARRRAHLVARSGRAVVDARVADELLQQLGHFARRAGQPWPRCYDRRAGSAAPPCRRADAAGDLLPERFDVGAQLDVAQRPWCRRGSAMRPRSATRRRPGVTCAPTGRSQPPPSAARKARSTSTAARLGLRARWPARSARVASSSSRHSTASAPWRDLRHDLRRREAPRRCGRTSSSRSQRRRPP